MKASVAWRGLAVGILALTLASVAHASPILTLFNTGVFASGLAVPNGTVGDLHYTLTAVPGGTTVLLARTSVGGFPVPPWLADDAVSTWIGPNNDVSLDGAPGVYDYRTTFDLTGFTPASASLIGNWATDNSGVDILINGVSTGKTSPGFTAFTPFTISSGFKAGVNTLDFMVQNLGTTSNPTGLRVEISGTATAAAVPEPASLLLFGAGLAGISMIPRRRFWAVKNK